MIDKSTEPSYIQFRSLRDAVSSTLLSLTAKSLYPSGVKHRPAKT